MKLIHLIKDYRDKDIYRKVHLTSIKLHVKLSYNNNEGLTFCYIDIRR